MEKHGTCVAQPSSAVSYAQLNTDFAFRNCTFSNALHSRLSIPSEITLVIYIEHLKASYYFPVSSGFLPIHFPDSACLLALLLAGGRPIMQLLWTNLCQGLG